MLGGAGERFGGDVMGRGLSSSRRVIKLIRARVRDIATSRPFSYISEWAEVNNIEIAYTSANSPRLNQSLVTSQPSGEHIPASQGAQAAMGSWTWIGRRGGTARPSGKSSPVSSKMMTPLHSRLHPCPGWKAMEWAESRSGRSAEGHAG